MALCEKKKLHEKILCEIKIFLKIISGIGYSSVQFCLGYYNTSE